MSLRTEKNEIDIIVDNMLDNLGATITSQTGRNGVELRRQIGELRADYMQALKDETFASQLSDCFSAAYDASVTLASLAALRNALFEETATGDIAKAIVLSGVTFCLSTEAKLIVGLVFTSRDDVETMIVAMRDAFDAARELAADSVDSATYLALTTLAGSLTAHLAYTARPLPRMVTFQLGTPLPAMALSQRLYYTAERWEELISENKIIHPAFCPSEVRGLSR